MGCPYLNIDGNMVYEAEDSVLAFAVDVGGGAIFGIFVFIFVDVHPSLSWFPSMKSSKMWLKMRIVT